MNVVASRAPSRVASRLTSWHPPLMHRQNRFGTNHERVARALILASILYVIVMIVMGFVVPRQAPELRVIELEPIKPKFLVEEPKLAPPPALTNVQLQAVAVRQVSDPVIPEGIVPEPQVLPEPLRQRKPETDAGEEGRRRAREATQEINKATAALDQALGDLTASVRSSKDGSPGGARRRARQVGAGRSESELAGFDTRLETGGADLEHSKIAGSVVAIGTIAPSAPITGDGENTEARSGSAPGIYRSNASLLAVIQRYAAGIQFCYETELNRQPGLRGKLVVALTVAASGEVTEATVVQNTLGSSRIASCALAQIRQWKFPPIAGGTTSFQTPFVFTPPN